MARSKIRKVRRHMVYRSERGRGKAKSARKLRAFLTDRHFDEALHRIMHGTGVQDVRSAKRKERDEQQEQQRLRTR